MDLSKLQTVFVEEVDSTQNYFIEHISRNTAISKEPVLIIAQRQRTGRGRGNNSWYSPSGGFWATLGIKIEDSISQNQLILMHYFTALMLTDLINNKCEIHAGIKWPNDILYNGKKMGGILVELISNSSGQYLLIGMGININNPMKDFPEDLQESVITLSSISEDLIDIGKFASHVALVIPQYLSCIFTQNSSEIAMNLSEYSGLCSTLNRSVTLISGEKAEIKSINRNGDLTIMIDGVDRIIPLDESFSITQINQ